MHQAGRRREENEDSEESNNDGNQFLSNRRRPERQLSFFAGPGAKSDFGSDLMDPNPILDIWPLDSTPFFHGYGSNCRDGNLVNGIWRLPTKPLTGFEAKFSFYIVPGEGVLLFGNEIRHKSILHGPENCMAIPSGVGG